MESSDELFEELDRVGIFFSFPFLSFFLIPSFQISWSFGSFFFAFSYFVGFFILLFYLLFLLNY